MRQLVSCLFILFLVQAGSDENERLRKDAVPAWKAFNLKFFESINGSLEYFDGSQTNPRQIIQLKAKKNQFMIAVSGLKLDSEKISVFCRNERYGFRLIGDEKDGWAIQKAIPSDSPGFLESIKLNGDSPLMVGLSPASLVVESLESFVLDPSFQLRKMENLSDGTVLVEFELHGERSNKMLEQVVGGTVVLIPSKCWLPKRFEVTFSAGFTQSTVFEYEPNSDLPISSKTITKSPNGRRTGHCTMNWNFDGYKLRDRVFTLTNFGIREPDFLQGPSSRNWIGLAVGTAFLFALLVLVMRFRSRLR